VSGPRFVLRMAWRESRAGRRRLWLLTSAITAGVAALVAINSFTQNLRSSVAQQARALLGADLSFSSGRAFPARVEALLDSLITPDSTARAARGRRALQVSFVGMAYVPRTTGVRLVQVRAVEGGYPFYGEITTDPAGRWRRLAEEDGALVDPVFLSALGARVGDTLALGEARFPILGTVLNVPGDVGVFSAFGARVYIPARTLPATGLLQFGSRAEYEAFVELPKGTDAQAIARRYRTTLRELRVGIRTVESDRENLTEALSRLGNYLGLVALVALLLGGLGVASAVNVFIKQKLDTIAVLRCLGATSGDVFAVYLLQALLMGGIGSAIGAGIGVALQQLLPLLFRGLLPVDVHVVPSPRSILLGFGLGLWVAGMFAALPLLGVRRVSPLMTLRRDVEPAPARSDRLARAIALLIAASVVALAGIQVGRLRDGLLFAGAIGIALLSLWLAARGLMRGIRRWFPTRLPYLWRQGLANLYRPANQTVTVVLALGFGAFILTTLFIVQRNLLHEFRPGGSLTRPNLMLYDIQPAQREGVAALIRQHGVTPAPAVPIVTMRLTAVKGVPVSRLLPPPDTTAAQRGPGGNRRAAPRKPGTPIPWALRHEYRATYRDTLTGTEKVVAGRWWGRTRADSIPPVSLEKGVATDLVVTPGDELTWDVRGSAIRTRVANLREVEWRRFETNFFVVFPSGVLEAMPQMLVMLVRADSATTRGRLQRQVAERFPNITILDLSQIQQALEAILDRGALIVRFLALFSLATGAIVLVGSVSASRLQRIREAVLLKTLGATRGQVLHILVAEYTALGVLAALMSAVLASVAGWALAKWVFAAPYQLPVLALSLLTLLLIGLTLGVGLWNSAEILKRTPLAVLREE
jgi:putative ABC transport system permease protein